jgi:hypothetical protein
MWANGTSRAGRAAAACLLAGAVLAACGDEDFANDPRPPVPIDLSGVVQDDGVTVSPARVGAGPLRITFANLTDAKHTITLEGESLRTRIGPIGPGDTGVIQKTLEPGDYEVRAGSSRAVPKEIPAAQLRIGKQRRDSNDRLLLP